MERARVLIVDDDASIRETLELHFHGVGHEVTTAASAEDALSQLASVDPTLVVTDVRMGGMDGLALLETLRFAGFVLLAVDAIAKLLACWDSFGAYAWSAPGTMPSG